MIGMLHGQVDFIDAASAIIEVGGVGYETRMPSADLASMHAGQTVKVYTSLKFRRMRLHCMGFPPCFETHVFAITEGQRNWSESRAFLAFDVASGTFGESCGGRGCHRAGEGAWSRQEGCAEDYSRTQGVHRSQSDRGGFQRGSFCGRCRFGQVVEGLMSLGWRQQDALHAVQTVCESNHINVPLRDDDVPRVLKLALASLDRGR